MQDKALNIYVDGGSRGNPGPSACAFVSEVDGKPKFNQSKYLGINTNNFAEYSGVILALEWLTDYLMANNFSKVVFHLDSLLIESQLNGKFKVKNDNLKKMFITAKELEKKISAEIIYKHVYREKNKLADLLVNKCLDKISRTPNFNK